MKVSVCMITYNHEKYIKQAIESILMQKVNFDYEIVIGEDASTDYTRNVILEFKNKFPKKIKLLLHDNNLGMLSNFINTIQSCSGKFIAILEGDDYWTDENKLQKQLDFLETNPGYVLCHHDATFLDETGTGKTGERIMKFDEEFDSDTEDLLILNRASTLTVMFRNNLIKTFPKWYYKALSGDWPLWIMLSKYGKLKYLPFIGAVYRISSGNATSVKRAENVRQRRLNMIKIFEEYIYFYENFNNHFKFKYSVIIQQQQQHYYYYIYLYYFALKEYKKAKELINTKKISWILLKTLKDKIKYILIKTFITTG